MAAQAADNPLDNPDEITQNVCRHPLERRSLLFAKSMDPANPARRNNLMLMPIRTTKNGDTVELLVSGRVDGEAANQLELEILNAIRGGAGKIFVNMADVNFLCSAGIRVLLQYWRQMKNSGKSLQVASPSAEVNSVLETTGFRNMIVEGAQPAS